MRSFVAYLRPFESLSPAQDIKEHLLAARQVRIKMELDQRTTRRQLTFSPKGAEHSKNS
ncbi:uncharacterized protein LOC116800286 [Drosophila sechellia]|uniref:uncharacterized protein LOC116800286 n=1 Tax=Drosophila sechellia TaxID=7238 RepID=UPI0013DDDA9C|nr:uncharacterized protein LOC116800286 [Drosophila sechellia]